MPIDALDKTSEFLLPYCCYCYLEKDQREKNDFGEWEFNLCKKKEK